VLFRSISDNAITTVKINDAAVTSAKLAADAVTSAKILDGEIVNADINTSAAIADSKLATIATAGKVSNSATTATADNTALVFLPRLNQFNDGVNQSFTALRNDNTVVVNLPSYSFSFSMPYTPLVGSWSDLH
jgi:hypothetical protein